jgi:hypothetical protein
MFLGPLLFSWFFGIVFSGCVIFFGGSVLFALLVFSLVGNIFFLLIIHFLNPVSSADFHENKTIENLVVHQETFIDSLVQRSPS